MARRTKFQNDLAALLASEDGIKKLRRQMRLLREELQNEDGLDVVFRRMRKIERIASRATQKQERPPLSIIGKEDD